MKKFTSDEYFHIGKSHLGNGTPCQDYAVSDTSTAGAHFALSDGCSSGRRTDVGARLLTLATNEALRKNMFQTDITQVIRDIRKEQEVALYVSKQLYALDQQDLLATSLYGRFDSAGGFIHIEGDGVVALVKRDGSITLYRYEWSGNMPYYPAYRLQGQQQFLDAMGDDPQAKVLTRESWILHADTCSQGESREYSVQEGMNGITHCLSAEEIEEIDFVAVFSDGVTQVDAIDWRQAAQTFLRFKSVQGAFAKRRMARGIASMQKLAKGPLDDIAYAVIHIQHEEKNDDTLKQEDNV